MSAFSFRGIRHFIKGQGFVLAAISLTTTLLPGSLSGENPQLPPTPVPPSNLGTATSPDNRYGQGGMKEVSTDQDKNYNKWVWKDSQGNTKEVRIVTYNGGEQSYEDWEFYRSREANPDQGEGEGVVDEKTRYTLTRDDTGAWSFQSQQLLNGQEKWGQSDSKHNPVDCESYMANVEEQFAKDGSLPSTFFAPKKEGNKLIETNLDQTAPSTSSMDPCLVGTWECVSFNEEGFRFFAGGGTGFKVTFKSDGTETVDYSSMQPTRAGPHDKIIYAGTASARISTSDGVAKIEKMESLGATLTLQSVAVTHQFGKLPNLGPGGLGSTKDNNKYTCTEDTLEYKTSVSRDEKANCTVKLTRIRTTEALPPPLPPNKNTAAAPDESKNPPADKTRAQEAAMLKALEGNPDDKERQRDIDKTTAEIDAYLLRSKLAAQRQKGEREAEKCEGLKEEIRKRQGSLTELEGRAREVWVLQGEASSKAHNLQRQISEAQKDGDEEKRGKLIKEARDEYSRADGYNAKISNYQAQQEQVRKEIEDLMTQLANCKSKP